MGWPDRTSRDRRAELHTRQDAEHKERGGDLGTGGVPGRPPQFNVSPGGTHGACGAVWLRPHRGASLVLARLCPSVSSCRGPVDRRPPSCSGRRRTERPAAEQKEKTSHTDTRASTGQPEDPDRYLLLRGGAEAGLLSVRLVSGRMSVGVFCHVLRLLHQL